MEITLKNDNQNTTHIKHYVGMSMNQMRHLEIDRIIQDKHILSLLDLGCSEGLLIQKLGRSDTIQLLVGVDIEESALSYCSLNTFPENIQETIQFSRQHDQNIHIYQGDATKKYKRLKDFNVELVTLVELIEHLHPDQIPLAVDNVFGYLQPKYCFISTPNKEFNEFFQFEEGQLRHWDHKFEWNRGQFQSFCLQIETKYGYSFIVNGVGEHTSDNSKGHCTQYALFTKNQERMTSNSGEDEQQLVQKAYYTNKSWRSNIPKIMRGLLFKSLYYTEEVTFEQAVQFVKKEHMGNCLQRTGEVINKELIIKYLQLNSDDFDWEEDKYRLKAAPEEEEELEEQASQGINSHFESSFSKSSFEYGLSISESYPRKQPSGEVTLTTQ